MSFHAWHVVEVRDCRHFDGEVIGNPYIGQDWWQNNSRARRKDHCSNEAMNGITTSDSWASLQGGKLYGERAGICRIVKKKQYTAHSSDNNACECCNCGEESCPESFWLFIPEYHGYNPCGWQSGLRPRSQDFWKNQSGFRSFLWFPPFPFILPTFKNTA